MRINICTKFWPNRKNNFKYAIKYAINLKCILIKLFLDFKYFSKSIIKLNKKPKIDIKF